LGEFELELRNLFHYVHGVGCCDIMGFGVCLGSIPNFLIRFEFFHRMRLIHAFRLLNAIRNECVELLSDLHWADVTEAFMERLGHAFLFAT